MTSGSRKGSGEERTICKILSLWWSDGEDDNVFYRTDGSGGRATRRAQRGQSTAGAYGDVGATSPTGQPLLDRTVIEIKTGYKGWNIQDLIDSPMRKGVRSEQTYERFLLQCMQDRQLAVAAGLPIIGCTVIAKRNGRRRTISIEAPLYNHIQEMQGPWPEFTRMILKAFTPVTWTVPLPHDSIMMDFEDFLKWVQPSSLGGQE